jgi:hypothetical protein
MLNRIDNSVVENWVSLTSKLTAYTYFLLNLPSSARRQLIRILNKFEVTCCLRTLEAQEKKTTFWWLQ